MQILNRRPGDQEVAFEIRTRRHEDHEIATTRRTDMAVSGFSRIGESSCRPLGRPGRTGRTGYSAGQNLSMDVPDDYQLSARVPIQRQYESPSAIEMLFEQVAQIKSFHRLRTMTQSSMARRSCCATERFIGHRRRSGHEIAFFDDSVTCVNGAIAVGMHAYHVTGLEICRYN